MRQLHILCEHLVGLFLELNQFFSHRQPVQFGTADSEWLQGWNILDYFYKYLKTNQNQHKLIIISIMLSTLFNRKLRFSILSQEQLV